jgi:hypothetical protein
VSVALVAAKDIVCMTQLTVLSTIVSTYQPLRSLCAIIFSLMPIMTGASVELRSRRGDGSE